MRYPQDQLVTILLPNNLCAEIISHCRRKLHGDYLPGEGQGLKAFGLIGGKIGGTIVTVEAIVPLFKNARDYGVQKKAMDSTMNHHAIPSETPFEQRGWVAEQKELDNALHTLQTQGLRLIGNYHMHRVAWSHDSKRDTPTELDTVLGKESRLLMFIVSMVNPETPIIRAFFEGVQTLELPIQMI